MQDDIKEGRTEMPKELVNRPPLATFPDGKERFRKITEENSPSIVPDTMKPPILDDIMDKIRHFVGKRRLRLKDWFKDFDPLGVGKVTRLNFIRAMHMAYPEWLLHRKELDAVMDYFRDPLDHERILYRRFSSEVYTRQALGKPPIGHGYRGIRLNRPDGPNFMHHKSNAILKYAMETVAARNVWCDTIDIFRNLDKYRTGLLDYEGMLRGLKACDLEADLPAYQKDIIFKAFCTEERFDYRRFLYHAEYAYRQKGTRYYPPIPT